MVSVACGSPGPLAPSQTIRSTLLGSRAVHHLPTETLAVVTIRHPARLPGPLLDALTRHVLGQDHTPAALNDLGIDGDRPMGLALVDWVSETWIGFAGLTDPGRLQRALRRRYPSARMDTSDAGIIMSVPSAGLGFVVTDAYLFAVRSQVASKRQWAESRLASVARGPSLTGRPGFARVVAGLPHDAAMGDSPTSENAVGVYIAADRIAGELIRDAEALEAASMERVTQARSALEHARSGSRQDESGSLAAALDSAENRLIVARVHAARRIAIVEQLIGSWGTVGGVVTLDGAIVDVHARATLTENGLLARLAASLPPPGSLPVPSEARSKTRSAVQGQTPEETAPPAVDWPVRLRMATDPRALLDLLRALHLAADPLRLGDGPGRGTAVRPARRARERRMVQRLDQRLGVDLERELTQLLSGTMDLAWSEGIRSFSLALGVRDPGRAAAWTTRVPGLDVGQARVKPRIFGDRLVLGTTITRSTPISTSPPGPASLTMTGPFWLQLLARSPAVPRYEARPLAADDNPDVPFSDDHRAAVKRFTAANQRLASLGDDLTAWQRDRVHTLSEPLGVLDVRFGVESMGTRPPGQSQGSQAPTGRAIPITVRGRWHLRADDLTAALDRVQQLERSFATRRQALEGSAQQILIELDELEKQLRRIRVRDVQRWDLREVTSP